jgi:hypothetical protein
LPEYTDGANGSRGESLVFGIAQAGSARLPEPHRIPDDSRRAFDNDKTGDPEKTAILWSNDCAMLIYSTSSLIFPAFVGIFIACT